MLPIRAQRANQHIVGGGGPLARLHRASRHGMWRFSIQVARRRAWRRGSRSRAAASALQLGVPEGGERPGEGKVRQAAGASLGAREVPLVSWRYPATLVCPERVRLSRQVQAERRRRKLRPETLRHTNGRLRKQGFHGLWRVVNFHGSPTEGERRRASAPDLSGRRTEGRQVHPWGASAALVCLRNSHF
jgi:hypothetical protein